jgi:hypothetical protein
MPTATPSWRVGRIPVSFPCKGRVSIAAGRDGLDLAERNGPEGRFFVSWTVLEDSKWTAVKEAIFAPLQKGAITVTRPTIIAAVVIAIALPVGARAQGSMPVGSSGQLGQMSQTEDVPHRAAAAYNRGARELRKAANAKDPADKKKHYSAAQAHFKKSLDLQQNFDALLGLGQADLALGDNAGARATCRDALILKPASTEAKACADTAEANLAPAATPAPPAAAPPAPPPLEPSSRR